MRILCVDDDNAIRMTTKAFLDDLGHQVQCVSDGEACLRSLPGPPFDVILLDLNMPGMGGIATLQRIRTLTPETPVVVVSGTGSIQDVIDALRLGASDFITKPIEDMALLVHSIEAVAERARLIRENREHRERLEAMVEERTRSLIQEVNDRKAVEAALRATLSEKTVLLKEVHHRVKNNLQIVSSLLSLQAMRCEEERMAAPLQDSQSRIRAMAMVHEKLYRSPDLARIDLSSYLSELTNFLIQTFCPPTLRVTPEIDCEDFHLTVESAIPCGLIINELVTNALKHAFKGRSTGALRLRVRQEPDETLIEVRDDGVGLPPGLDLNNPPSLGLQLILNLARQLGGGVRTDSSAGGVSFRLRFPTRQESA